jgi:hypothetical protein
MATERLLMRHIREILRLKWTLRRSHRETARSLGISAGAVASVVTRAKAMGLTWDGVGALSDDALERTLYGPKLALAFVNEIWPPSDTEIWPPAVDGRSFLISPVPDAGGGRSLKTVLGFPRTGGRGLCVHGSVSVHGLWR